jgi:hypothetical protein
MPSSLVTQKVLVNELQMVRCPQCSAPVREDLLPLHEKRTHAYPRVARPPVPKKTVYVTGKRKVRKIKSRSVWIVAQAGLPSLGKKRP